MEIRYAKRRSQRCLETLGTSGTAPLANEDLNCIVVNAEKIRHEILSHKE